MYRLTPANLPPKLHQTQKSSSNLVGSMSVREALRFDLRSEYRKERNEPAISISSLTLLFPVHSRDRLPRSSRILVQIESVDLCSI
jgi:hypothetical protein